MGRVRVRLAHLGLVVREAADAPDLVRVRVRGQDSGVEVRSSG